MDPLVYHMSVEDPGDITYNQIGGLSEQVRELREVGFYLLMFPCYGHCGTMVQFFQWLQAMGFLVEFQDVRFQSQVLCHNS